MWAARRSPPKPQTSQAVHVPAPVRGINSVAPGGMLPELQCTYMYNLIPSEFGLRSRLGYQEYVTGLAGTSDTQIRTLIPYLGSTVSANRLFAATSSGIFDVTDSVAIPEDWEPSTDYAEGDRVRGISGPEIYVCVFDGTSFEDVPGPSGTGTGITDGSVIWDYETSLTSWEFATQTGNAGYGVYHAVVTAGGHYLLYADEVNGLWRYTESTDTWALVTDITGVAEADIRFVTVFKNRVWLVEKDSQRAWYLAAGAISGAAAQFPFTAAGSFRQGGPLVGLWNWTYDGGNGLDDALVAITAGGDILVYQGTDPASADTFGLKGVWSCGAIPAGRTFVTDFGGDLLIESLIGVVPLSKLVLGADQADERVYETRDISNLFASYAMTYGTQRGWALHIHPTDNALLLLIPQATGEETIQLAMSFGSHGWGQYRDLPIFSACVWNGELWFGTADGRVCVNRGYVDGVELADPDTYTPVQWSLLTAFSSGDSANRKRLKQVRPIIQAPTPMPTVEATARYDFNTTEPAPPTLVGSAAYGTWGNALWGTAVWGGSSAPSMKTLGLTGEGVHVAVALRGTAFGRTTLVGMDIFLEQGGTR